DILLDPGVPTDGVPNRALAVRALAQAAASTQGNGVDPSTASWLRSGVQWDLNTMRVPDAWKLATKLGTGARVCIIDTGIDGGHQELAGRLVDSTSFVYNNGVDSTAGYSSPTLDSVGHGSHVAGTVAAKGLVMAGIAPRASVMIAKVFAATGGTPTDRVVNSLVWCTDHGADVVNMSLGGTRFKNDPGSIANIAFYQAGIDYANAAGVIVVASAGNDNVQVPNPVLTFAPAFNRGIVSVGSTGPLSKYPLTHPIPGWNPNDTTQAWRTPDSRAYYSNFGSDVTVFAPGGNLGYNLAWPFRYYQGVLQGVSLDGIYSVCSSSSIEFQPWVDSVGAPSLQGSSTCAGIHNTYADLQGTSMASPHVAGLMALVTAEIGGPRTVARRQRAIGCVTRSTDVIGPSSTFGGGRVNAFRAIQLLRNNGC
ncbi:MAG TPA: S8 family serine peptidase, partial [Gemmatirosa sp.]